MMFNPRNDAYFKKLRRKEFARLDKLNQVYLDYTGGHLYPETLLKKHYRYLQKEVYGNPHSVNPPSVLSEKNITETRQAVLDFFNAGDYYCIFTPNATGALKIIAESYPFSEDSHLLLTTDNHNSVNGIREYCRKKGGEITYSPVDAHSLRIREDILHQHLMSRKNKQSRLFAFPGQSNVSGVQHPLEWIQKAKMQGWDVLLDAAALAPSSVLDLSVVKPDFVSLSFYKIFGYPTGIGCLLVKKDAFEKLKKPWFAGGTITLSAVTHNNHFLKQDHERFEDGTVNYLGIPAVREGLSFIKNIGMQRIHERVRETGSYILTELSALKHKNGRPLIKLYGPQDMEDRGGTFLMNFYDERGNGYPISLVEQTAGEQNIALRTGCFCNPGIDELNHSLTEAELKSYFSSRQHGDYFDVMNFLGKTRGAVRLSIGFPTTKKDIRRFVAFAGTFLDKTYTTETITNTSNKSHQHFELHAEPA